MLELPLRVRPDRSRQALGNRRPGRRSFLGEARGVELVQAAEQDDAAVSRTRDRVTSPRLEDLAGWHLAEEVDRQPRAVGPLDHLASRHDPRQEDGQVVLQRSSKADFAPRAAGAHRRRVVQTDHAGVPSKRSKPGSTHAQNTRGSGELFAPSGCSICHCVGLIHPQMSLIRLLLLLGCRNARPRCDFAPRGRVVARDVATAAAALAQACGRQPGRDE